LPDYKVRVVYTYLVQAISAEDALSTVPTVIKGRFIGFHGEGLTEIINNDGRVVLKAKLVNHTEQSNQIKKGGNNGGSFTQKRGGN